MNIALIVRKYQTSGGTERFTYNLSKYLAKAGNNVTIFCNKAKVISPDKNIEIFKLPSLPLNRTVKTLFFNFIVNKKVKLHNFDIVQGCGKIYKQDIYRAGGGFHKLFLKIKGIKQLTWYDKAVMRIESKIYNPKNTRYVIAVSNFIAKEIKDEFNYPLERIKVFHNPVDLNFFNNKNREKIKKEFREKYKILNNETVFLFVANNFKLKGLNSILEAIKNFNKWRLFVVGGDSLNISNELKKQVFFLGEIKGDKIINFYKSADVLLHPTYFDPFANVCLEAMACGVPVVTTKINGVSEILKNYNNGIILDNANNISMLKQSIGKLINDKNFLSEISINAYKTAQNYSIENYVAKLIKFYQKVKQEKFDV